MAAAGEGGRAGGRGGRDSSALHALGSTVCATSIGSGGVGTTLWIRLDLQHNTVAREGVQRSTALNALLDGLRMYSQLSKQPVIATYFRFGL